MVVAIDTLKDALAGIEAVVVDHTGVLHDRSAPCLFAIEALSGIDQRLAILSNSDRAAPRADGAIVVLPSSLEHDIAGVQAAGWRSDFIRAGLHTEALRNTDAEEGVRKLAQSEGRPLPDFPLRYPR